MRNTIKTAIEESLMTLGIPLPVIEIASPKEESHGDLSTPVAMTLSKALRKKPRDLAEEIVKNIKNNELFEKIEIAGPGFINFTFSRDFINSSLKTLIKEKDNFIKPDVGNGKRIQIEFVSANPTGPMHLGHGRGAAFGNALANLLEAGGFEVEREYYVNDAGRQTKLLGESVFARYQELMGVSCPMPEDGYKGDYVKTIAEEIVKKEGDKYKGKSLEEAKGFFIDFCLVMMLDWIKADLDLFGVRFDTWQSERGLYQNGSVQKAIDYLTTTGKMYEGEGALWFKATDFKDEKDRVVKKSDGEFTYFASDIAYHKLKIDNGFDELINIWGADHHGYIPRLEAVIDALGYDRKKLRVLLVQMVTLLRAGVVVQMSKRSGEFVTLKEVIEEVGADTTKFIFLTRRPDSHLEFDIEVAKAQSSENPVFYVQYANARINSIFKNAIEKGIDINRLADADLYLLDSAQDIKLIKKLLIYPMVFESAVIAREPHRITFYLQELSTFFHQFYNKQRVVSEDRALTSARLALCEAVRVVLKDGLKILGVTAPERM